MDRRSQISATRTTWEQTTGYLLLASRREGLQPDTRPTHELLAAVYEGLSGGIMEMSDRISIEDLTNGMLAAARLVCDIDAGDLESDRHEDDVCKTRILVAQLRITEHREQIERRHLDRKRKAVETINLGPTPAVSFR